MRRLRVVGVVESTGEGINRNYRINPMQNLQPAVRSADTEREPLPVSGDAERPLPDARRDVPGRPEG